MSNPWNIRKGIGDPQGPNGEYNRSNDFGGGINAKRVRNNLWPSGKFNDQDGPLSALQNSDSSMRSMSKNLSTNQTVMTLYINIPRLVVPIQIPHITEARNIPVAKCICAGDVVFQLRYNEVMLKNGDATQFANRYMPDLVYCANLATINYIIFGIQTLMADVYADSVVPNMGSLQTQAEFSRLWDMQKTRWSASTDIIHKARLRFNLFLNTISSGDFSSMMSSCFFDGYFEQVNYEKDTTLMKKDKFKAFVDDFLWDFINTYAKIGGIFIGSDNQGGAHYGDPNPKSYAPTDFVGTLQVAGKNFKARNMWSACQGGTSSGDILGFKLKYFRTKRDSHPPLVFRLSSNSITQNEQTVSVSQNLCDLGGYSMLVPSKNKRDVVHSEFVMAEERNNGFLQFGICDQISKPSNIYNNPLISACDATASVVPAPFQIYMRLGFTNYPPANLVMLKDPMFNAMHTPAVPVVPTTLPPPLSPLYGGSQYEESSGDPIPHHLTRTIPGTNANAGSIPELVAVSPVVNNDADATPTAGDGGTIIHPSIAMIPPTGATARRRKKANVVTEPTPTEGNLEADADAD